MPDIFFYNIINNSYIFIVSNSNVENPLLKLGAVKGNSDLSDSVKKDLFRDQKTFVTQHPHFSLFLLKGSNPLWSYIDEVHCFEDIITAGIPFFNQSPLSQYSFFFKQGYLSKSEVKSFSFTTKAPGYLLKTFKFTEKQVNKALLRREKWLQRPVPAQENNLWGYKNAKGEWLVKAEFDEARHFEYGFGVVKKNGKWGAFDVNGNKIFDCKFEYLNPCNSECCAIGISPKSFLPRYIYRNGLIQEVFEGYKT